MAYVDGDSLQVRIRVAFGASIAADPATWVWTDVTAWWHVPDEVRIGWGRSSGAEQAETSTLSLTLKNSDGRFTAYDPRSPYWPHVQKWTPIQYDIDLGDGQGWRNRFSGYVRKWPVAWPGRSSRMALAKIEAVGLLGRLGRGKPPVKSPLRRSIAGSGPVAYWPVEDGTAAGQAASAISTHAPLSITGTVQFRPIEGYEFFGTQVDAHYGTGSLADLSQGGQLSATLPGEVAAATVGEWAVGCLALVPMSAIGADVVVMSWETPGGTYVRWELRYTANFHEQIVAYDAAGAATWLYDDPGLLTSFAPHIVWVYQDGGLIRVQLGHGDGFGSGASTSGTLAGVQGRLTVNATRATATEEMPFGHITVWTTAPIFAGLGSAFTDSYGGQVDQPWRAAGGETAHDRLIRLCDEDGVPLSVPAVPAEGITRMGVQPTGTLLGLLRECERSDQGLLYEEGFGLGYLPRASRYNPPVALTIDAALGQLGMPFEPVDDDQTLRNKWTVQREGGSSASAVDQESIDQQGEIEASVTVSLATDTPLADHAGWRLHLSTVQEPRYPALSVNLGAHRELAAPWVACKPGSRVQVVNPPLQAVPGVIDQLIVGATETYEGRRSWKATLNLAPGAAWRAFKVGDAVLGRLDTSGSELALAVDGTDTTLLVATDPGRRLWITTAERPQDFPFAAQLGGEVVRVTAIDGDASPQTWTVDRSVNSITKPHPAGTRLRLAPVAV